VLLLNGETYTVPQYLEVQESHRCCSIYLPIVEFLGTQCLCTVCTVHTDLSYSIKLRQRELLKGTVSPHYNGLKVLWVDRPG
jgi:hypothetical protein